MRQLFVLLLLFWYTALRAQDTLRFYEKVNVPEFTKDQLFSHAHTWVDSVFESSSHVLQYSDRRGGLLVGNAAMPANATYRYRGKKYHSYHANFTIEISVQDGSYKYEFKNFQLASARDTSYDLGLLTTSESCPKSWPNMRPEAANQLWSSVKKDIAGKTKILAALMHVFMTEPELVEVPRQ